MTNKTEMDNKLKSIIDELPNKVIKTILLKHDYDLEHKPNGLRKVMLFDLIENKGEYISLLDYQDEINGLESMMENSRKIKKIERLIKDTDNELVKGVVNMVLDMLEEPTDECLDKTTEDILKYGCINGCVPGLIYYKDTHEFTHKYLEEILTLLNEYQQGTGEPIKLENNPVNFLCWFGFEITLSNTLDMLDDLQ